MANHGLSEAVRVFVQVLERRAFGAHEALAEGILLVATNVEDVVAVQGHVQAAGGLAQGAGVEGAAFGA